MKTYQTWILAIMGLIILFGGFYFIFGNIDTPCLEEHSNNFCIENNYSGGSSINMGYTFHCYNDSNERTRISYSSRFFLLDEEVENCRTKDPYTFVKKGDTE